MRLVNVKERMPTERDCDSAFEVAWVLVYAGSFGTKNVFSAHDHWTHEGMRADIGAHAAAVEDRIEVFWVDISGNPPEQPMQAPVSHVRRVEL